MVAAITGAPRHDRLVSYSLSVPERGVPDHIVRQLEISWSTLRQHNPSMPVVLFMHGPIPDAVAGLSRSLDIMVDLGAPYPERLRTWCPAGAEALARYPTLHKFLNMERLAGSGANQVLCCDCDTIFAGDVEHLFDRYEHVAHVVAREEVNCRRSPYGYDATFIDEDLLGRIGAEVGGRPLPPFNLGAVLLNHLDWSAMLGVEGRFVDLAWRFVTWMAHHPLAPGSTYAEFDGIETARRAMTPIDVARALPYPSANRWILDEVALWIALGALDGLRFADFDPSDVAQNGEFAHTDRSAVRWTMCHYFSSTLDHVEAWLRIAA